MEATLTDASAAVNDAPCVRRDCDWPGRWKDLHTYLERPGPMQGDGFESGNNVKAFLHACKILVIGAGGLGCELLKNLALSGFTDIHLIDMDTIDVSNLNRQFLFRTDIGKSKAIVAAEFIMRRIPGCWSHLTTARSKTRMKPIIPNSVLLCGLDSVEARRWINATIVGMFDQDIPETLKPIIDGGTEDKACDISHVHYCQYTSTSEHCIEWASSVAWPKEFPASCANEAFKIATNCATYMNNYMMYTGDQGVYSYTFELQQKEDCPVCGSAELSLAISGDKTLADLIDMLLETQEMQLKSPSLRTATSSLYMQAPKMLREATLPNLQRKLKDLISPGELITVTDALLPISLELKLQL
ncbi:hypothetical protein BSLG_008970 [Batrachochytrium salamandrivorans]|nr:hypothetical protein BSLG_008970 [Batrachochytrium salamandrivorans]